MPNMERGPLSPPSTERPRAHSRGISIRSDNSGSKKDWESARDKERRDSFWKGTSKANPNAAINEIQPGVANMYEQSTLQSLRGVQHRDPNGNVITEPDLTNPTRPRFERPLDTIRNFEKAIDNQYKRRSSYRAEGADSANKRSSTYSAGYDSSPNVGRYAAGPNGGHVGGQRPDSYYSQAAGSHRPRYGAARVQSDSQVYGMGKVYPQHNYHQSHDTVNTGGSDSTGPWASNTDPSSEASSIDRAMKGTPPMDSYGYPPNNGPIMEEQAYDSPSRYEPHDGYGTPLSYGARGPPPRPATMGGYVQHAPPGQRKPIKLGNSNPGGEQYSVAAGGRPGMDKRKSWIKRRFGKD